MSGAVAQLGERGLCKPEVRGSIPLGSTSCPGVFIFKFVISILGDRVLIGDLKG
jgi:hypothetical protein